MLLARAGAARFRSLRVLLVVLSAFVFLSASGCSSTARAEADAQWPAWRGPLANGISTAGNPPLQWSESENVRFKVEVPGRGLASPVVWNDRIYVMTSVAVDSAAYEASQRAAAEKRERQEWPPAVAPVTQRFMVLAYSLKNGDRIWERTAIEKAPHEAHYVDSSWASGSPVTDGKRLIAHFGSNGTYAYDLDGKLLWSVDLGDQETRNAFGEGSSPVLHDDKVIINWDHEGDSFLVVLDANTGKEIWKKDRPGEVTSWVTPAVIEHGGKTQVIIPATGKSRGYDLTTGEVLWSVGGMSVNTIPTPVHDKGIVYLASGYRTTMLQAVALDRAKGELEETDALVWTHDRDTPYVPSMLLYDGSLYFIKHFKNIFSNLDAATGKANHDPQRLPGIHNVYASPVGAAGRIYIFDRDGHAVVLEHGKTFKVLAENSLDEGVDASPAIVGDELIVRGQQHLYCISAEGADSASAASRTEVRASGMPDATESADGP